MIDVVWPLMHNNITRSDLDKMIDYLKQDDPKLTQGPLVQAFEEQWSEWLGVKYSIMLNSGSSANDLTMMALKELKGSGEVIVPPLTWVSDVASIIKAGLTPVFVDIDPYSLAIDSDLVLSAITPQTRAVFLTHVLGYNGLTNNLIEGLKKQNVLLIEDVCESHGATHDGKKVGTFGWASNFSFYYAHHMTTIEGGIISTNDSELYDILRMLRSHGMVRESLNNVTKNEYTKKYPDLNPDFIFAFASHNMRSTELNAVLGLEQLKRLDQNNIKRTANLHKFLSVIDPLVFKTNFKLEGSSNYAFTLVLNEPDFVKRDKVEICLKSAGIEFRRGLSGGGNQLRQPYLRNRKGIPQAESFPNVEHVHHFSWYIGNFPELSHAQIDWLGNVLKEIGMNY
jgi:CDP-6-deoxy-D-xylo-4-hexulose-3-dehydrase